MTTANSAVRQSGGPNIPANGRPYGEDGASKKKLAIVMDAQGNQSRAAIARTLGVQERTVYRWLAEGLDTSGVKTYEGLDEDVRASLEFTADGFELFFNRYSGRTLTPMHKEWVQAAIENENLVLNVPPRHAKSTIFTVWFTIWLIAGAEAVRLGRTGKEFGLRDVQVLIVSQTAHMAKKFTNEISVHLATNELLIRDFGPFKPPGDSGWPWRPNQGELLVNGRRRKFLPGDLSLQVRGAGQQILGMEAHWVIIDDMASNKNQKTEGERENLALWFHGEVMSRLEPESRAIVVGQRLGLNDIYGQLVTEGTEDDRTWYHINFPAVLDWGDDEHEPTVLWPEKWSFDKLMTAYRRVTGPIFEVMYQQNPMPESRRIARKEWLYGDETHVGCVDEDEVDGPRSLLPGWVRVISIDPSPTRKAALIVADCYRPGWESTTFTIRILEMVHEPMTVHDMIAHLDRVQKMYSPSTFIFETVAAQRWFLQDNEMDRFKQSMRIIPHVTQHNKADVNLGVESLALDFEFGRITCPYGDADSRAMTELLFDQARAYPEGQYDDLLMALWFIKWNFGRLAPTEEVEAEATTGWDIPLRLQHDGYGVPARPDYGVPIG